MTNKEWLQKARLKLDKHECNSPMVLRTYLREGIERIEMLINALETAEYRFRDPRYNINWPDAANACQEAIEGEPVL